MDLLIVDDLRAATGKGLLQIVGRQSYAETTLRYAELRASPKDQIPRSPNGGKHRTNRQAQRAAAKKGAKR